MAITVRTSLALLFAVFGLLLASALCVGQDLPVAAPAAPEWLGEYQGAAYKVKDGAVSRADGLPVDTSAAAEVLKAKRVSDALDLDPSFADRLADRDAAEAAADSKLAEAEAAAAVLEHAASALLPAGVSSLVAEFSGPLPIRADALKAEAQSIRSDVDRARALADDVGAASHGVKAALDAFRASHSVEDKRALVESFASTVPVYREAAAHADAARGRAGAASAQAASSLAWLEGQSEGLLGGLGLPPGLPGELAGAADELKVAAAEYRFLANDLTSDADYMEAMSAEPAKEPYPFAWVLGGALAAGGLTAGTLWWARRRLGFA